MPTKDNYWLLRIGSGAAVLGAVAAGVGNLLHPITPRDDPPGVARVIAQSDLWTLIHLVIVIGIILLPAGLLAVRQSIAGNGLTDALTRLGMYVAWMGGVLRRDRIDPGRDHPGPYRQTDGGVADPDHHRPDRDHAVDVGDRRPPVAPIGERGEGLTCRGRTGDPFRLVRDLPLDDLSRDQVVRDMVPIREGRLSIMPARWACQRQAGPARSGRHRLGLVLPGRRAAAAPRLCHIILRGNQASIRLSPQAARTEGRPRTRPRRKERFARLIHAARPLHSSEGQSARWPGACLATRGSRGL
jgi:hypothetical protein